MPPRAIPWAPLRQDAGLCHNHARGAENDDDMHLELDDEARAALAKLLKDTLENTRWKLSRRWWPIRSVLAKLEPAAVKPALAPAPEPTKVIAPKLARGRQRFRRLALIILPVAFNLPAAAAGVNSHAYSCAQLHALIAQNRWIFINNPDFEDIVVADSHVCSFSDRLEWRSVATTDTPECVVYQCGQSRGYPSLGGM